MITRFWGEGNPVPIPHAPPIGRHVVPSSIHDERYKAILVALRQARERQGISQADLAKRLGRRQQFVSKYESGERRLDIIEFIDIADHLQISWLSLLG